MGNEGSGHDLAALQRLATEANLLAVEQRLGRFNIFNALGIVRRELQHSNFLAWLLDPNESHGQGDLFLRAVLRDILKNGTPEQQRLSLDQLDIRRVEVRREWRHIDLLVVSEEPSLVVAIENKVDAGEHSNQLQRYTEIVKTQWPGRPLMFVYLTPEGEEPSQEDWVSWSYADLHRVLTDAVSRAKGSMPADVEAFVGHYLNLIEGEMMNAPAVVELCRKIYATHRRAIDLIIEHRPVFETLLLDELEERLRAQSGQWLLTHRRTRWFAFAPESWPRLLPPIGTEPKNEAWQWFTLRFDAEPGKLYLTLWVGPTSDIETRSKLIRALEESAGITDGRSGAKDKAWRDLVRIECATWQDDQEDVTSIADMGLHRLSDLVMKLQNLPSILELLPTKAKEP